MDEVSICLESVFLNLVFLSLFTPTVYKFVDSVSKFFQNFFLTIKFSSFILIVSHEGGFPFEGENLHVAFFVRI
jgi:hypothetical protein